MNRRIEIYTRNHCVYCQRAKDLLRIKGVDFIEHDITDKPHKAAEMLQRSPQQTIPGIFIDNQPIGGCNDLFDLDERGALDDLLGLFKFPGGSLQSA